jgi:hypothetical protein
MVGDGGRLGADCRAESDLIACLVPVEFPQVVAYRLTSRWAVCLEVDRMIYRNDPRLSPQGIAGEVADMMRNRDKIFRPRSGWREVPLHGLSMTSHISSSAFAGRRVEARDLPSHLNARGRL